MTDNNSNEATESIIFNPIIYGNVRIRNNIYGDVESAHNINRIHIQPQIEISNNTKFTNNEDKIYVGENDYIFNKDLLKISNIDLIDNKINTFNSNFNNQIKDFTTNLDNFKVQTDDKLSNLNSNFNNQIKDLTTNLDENLNGFKVQTDNKFDILEKNLTTLFENIEENKKTVIERLEEDIILDNIDSDLYLILNKIEIELPEINEKTISSKFIITNTINKSSGIYCHKNNNIINLGKILKKIDLRNCSTLTFYCVDKNNWLVI